MKMMMQNATMFQDAAPVLPPQTGKGTASALRRTDSSGRFDEMLRGKEPSRDEALARTDPREGSARQQSPSRPGAARRPRNLPGSPASAAGDAHASKAAAADDATGAQAQSAAQGQRTGENAGEGGAAAAPGSEKGPDRGERSSLQRDSLAAEAQQNAQSAAAAQQGVAAVLLATAEGATSQLTEMDHDAPEATPVGPLTQAPAGLVAAPGDGPALSSAGLAPGTGEAAVPSTLTPDKASGPRIEQGEASAAAKPAGSLNDRVAVQKKGGAASLEGLPAASTAAVPDPLQNAEGEGEAGQSRPTTAAPGGLRAAAVSGAPTQGPAAPGLGGNSAGQQQVAPVEAPADGTASPDRVAQGGAENKGPRAGETSHGLHAAARGVTEETDRADAPLDATGSKTGSAAGTAKFVPLQGSAGQGGFSDAEKRGHPDQKAQGNEASPLQPQGLGLSAAVAAEAQQPETKPAASLKGELHESILSQIKQGVVTHDGKGNGQMSIRLNPGELGELKIQVRMEDNRLRVEVQADNRMVKDLLMSNLDSLKDSLTSKNLTMEGFDVSTGGGSFNTPLPEQKGSPRQQSFLRSARAGAYPDQGEEARVNYLTGDVNNLLDVRF